MSQNQAAMLLKKLLPIFAESYFFLFYLNPYRCFSSVPNIDFSPFIQTNPMWFVLVIKYNLTIERVCLSFNMSS